MFLSSAAVAVSGAILTIAVVSAVAACSPPAPMKHFVNESSDMEFSLEVAPNGRRAHNEYQNMVRVWIYNSFTQPPISDHPVANISGFKRIGFVTSPRAAAG